MQPDEGRTTRGSSSALLERYLTLVAFWLPRSERGDIVAELDGEIRSVWKEQEAELGRELSEDEMEALLERWGHPLRIAGRYLPRRHLIGPEVFPLYALALKAIALGYLGPWLLVWLGLVFFSPAYRAAHPGWELVGTLSSFWSIAFLSFGVLTLAFALLERSWQRSGTLPAWNVRRGLEHGPERDPDLISRASSSLELVLHLVFLVWWLSPVALPGFSPTGARSVWLELHARLFVPVLLLASAGTALVCVHWVRPRWTRARIAVRTALHGIWTLLLVRVLGDFADVGVQIERISAARAAGAEADGLVAVANLAVFSVFLILAAASAWSFAKDALRALRWERAHVRAAGCTLVALVIGSLAPDSRAQSRAGHTAEARTPTEAELAEFLRDRIDVQKKSLGAVVGIVSPAGRRIVARGRLAAEDQRAPDGDTLFELGSVTKVFTALLFADMVERGEVALDEPVARCLPEGVAVPEHGQPITLLDLATQTSGLPLWPSNLVQDVDGLARYSEVDLYDFLASHALARAPGAQWEYSNLGFGLLGHALALRADRDYGTLLRERVTAPLGMTSTVIAVSPALRERLATGHDAAQRPQPAWNVPALPGAGSLRSTANDLLVFLAACTGLVESPLAPALSAMLAPRRAGPGFEQALGWWLIRLGPGDPLVTHGGATHGFACTLAFDPKPRVGVVVLSNSVADDGGLAWHVLRPAFPVATASAARERRARPEVTLDPAVLAQIAGRYQPDGGAAVAIELRADGLWFVSESARNGLRLRAASEHQFFATEIELEVEFETDAKGAATSLTIRFAGTETEARRIVE